MSSQEISPRMESLAQRFFLVGLAAAVVAAIGAFMDFEHFARAYMLGFVYWLGIALSCLALLMLHHLVGGRWSFMIRRQLEAGSRTLPFFALAFLPVAAFVFTTHMYHWAHYEVGSGDAILDHKAPYLNPTFFLIRAAIFFVIWIGLATMLNRWSARQDEEADGRLVSNMVRLSGPGIVIYFLTVSLAVVDWMMSLEAHWFSTIYALIYIVGEGLLTWCLMAIVTHRLSDRGPIRQVASPERYHDLGNFMLAFVLLWAYISVSQLLIIWSANLPEVNPWYVVRFDGAWGWIGSGLILLHFAVPFFLLLFRTTKRNPRLLVKVAWSLAALRLVELFWLIKPSFTPEGPELSWLWLDLAVWLAIGGLWMKLFAWQLKQRPLLPVNDPRLPGEFAAAIDQKAAPEAAR